jgi:hypothetical protein
VQITVSVTVELPANGTVDAVEPLVVAAGQQAMRAAMRAACRAYERQVHRYPQCQGEQLQSDGTDERRLRTSFGRVVLHLRRLTYEDCGRRFRPAAFVASLGGLTVTARLRDACVLAGSSWPYATAALVLRGLCGVEISPEWVRQLTHAAGHAAARAQAALAVRLVPPTPADVRAERAARLAATAAPPASPPTQLLVGWDGGWVPSREQPGGMEGKVGVVATEVAPVGRHGRQRLVQRRSVATFGNAEQVGLLTYAAAQALGGDRALRQTVRGDVVVALLDAAAGPGGDRALRQTVRGDGAAWIKTQAALHFPEATTILDWPHLARAVHKAIRAARPGAANQEVRRQAHSERPALLWRGNVDGAGAAVLTLVPDDAPRPEAVEQTVAYLQEQRSWIGDYDAWQAAGEPVGSGMVEREVDLVINRRMTRQGMRWRRANADAVVALRVRTINATWFQEAA